MQSDEMTTGGRKLREWWRVDYLKHVQYRTLPSAISIVTDYHCRELPLLLNKYNRSRIYCNNIFTYI